MPLFQVIVLALVQGLTEFLPISSSAHLALAPWLLGWPDQGLTFDIALHLGTLLAVFCYFARMWVQVIAQGLGLEFGSDEQLKRNRALLWYLALGSVPVAVIGFLFKDQAEHWRNPFVIGGMLVSVGVLMHVADRSSTGRKSLGQITLADSLAIGMSQALAIVPGTSRSGITITTALFRDIDRATAARFSFLLSTPAIGGAALKALLDLKKAGGLAPEMLTPFLVGILVSGLTGCLVIALFIRYLTRNTLRLFILYRIIFGIIVLALAFFRRPAG
ncbi:MAG: undecaprenyl-diphosphate phosphatase [Acidobacteria bacterium]|nr:undecaprenyl-diphosphate phosphatase [Acidobacteriota bacterium]MBI3473231.1 undecaprenyl-diphosphate phosphatase [Candidatus Solibacter usitatus]